LVGSFDVDNRSIRRARPSDETIESSIEVEQSTKITVVNDEAKRAVELDAKVDGFLIQTICLSLQVQQTRPIEPYSSLKKEIEYPFVPIVLIA
jgi:hypothetical protein